MGAIVGSIAEVLWPIPDETRQKALHYLPAEMLQILKDFTASFPAGH